MHPAPSLIAFTTLSGLGFGLIAWLGLLGFDHAAPWAVASVAALAVALAASGLLASLFHLGNPQRFLKAFSQWRSSWLSREGVLAVATLGVFTLYTLAWIAGMPLAPLGWLAGALAVATVLATAMIYAQLRAVPRWRSPLTPALFLAASLAGGALVAGAAGPAIAALAALALVQPAAWLDGDRRLARSGSTLATATGLGPLGRLRQFEPPHTGRNYLLDEMVFVLGRRHAARLRATGLVLAALMPLALLLAFPFTHAVAGLAVLAHVAGVIVLRWLFYAEAEHVVGLYYGRR
jgi:sulfite dehydrogenase (quinone) subunit SoeC